MPNDPISVLDISLNYLKSQSIFEDALSVKLSKNELQPKVIARAWQKLVQDGYAYTESRQSSEEITTTRYFITFDGLIALSDAPFPFRGKPYAWKRSKLSLKRVWSIVSTLAIIINAVVVLAFTYLTYSKQYGDKPNTTNTATKVKQTPVTSNEKSKTKVLSKSNK